ncbi:MAG: 2'-5' RNA ligase family protein [Candidatus Saccharimonadales bacterium]
MDEYVIVSFLSVPEYTDFKRSNWPLHLTVVGNFYTELKKEELVDLLDKSVAGLKSLTVPSKTRQMFGSKHNLPVTELYRTEELQQFHTTVLNTFNQFIKTKTPQFNNDGYRPHITEKYDHKLTVGDNFQLQNVSLVKLENANALIIKTVELN